MTTTSEQDQPFRILMHHEVGDLIDESFSGPMDGAIAVAQVYDLLPQLHKPKRWHRLIPNHLRLYHGFLDWGPCNVGFSYVQFGDALHVLHGKRLRTRTRLFRPDVVLLEPDADKYILDEEKHSGGVSVFTIG